MDVLVLCLLLGCGARRGASDLLPSGETPAGRCLGAELRQPDAVPWRSCFAVVSFYQEVVLNVTHAFSAHVGVILWFRGFVHGRVSDGDG